MTGLKVGWVVMFAGAAACASGSQPASGPEGPSDMPRAEQGPGDRRGPPSRVPYFGFIPEPPPFPDSTLLGTPVLVANRGLDTALWVGTYGRGLLVARPKAKSWEQIQSKAGDSTAISWNFLNAIGFTRRAVWYGTVGNGFGRSLDGGKTWRNWGLTQLGPEWQYVAPDGVQGRRDTIYVATADGLRISGDDGQTWRCIRGPAPVVAPAAPPRDACTETLTSLPDEYLLALALAPDGAIWVGNLHGLWASRDGGRTWTAATGVPAERIRAVVVSGDSTIWAATETAYFRAPNLKGQFKPGKVDVPGYGSPPGVARAFIPAPFRRPPAIATSHGLLVPETNAYAQPGEKDSTQYHLYVSSGDLYHAAADYWTGSWDPGRLLPYVGSTAGFAPPLPIRPRRWDLVEAPPPSKPEAPKHPWLQRPIAAGDNPYIDQTYRYGSTMGGMFQQHQGVEFNNPDGTPVHAVADGTVVFAGPAEAAANTVAIRHDQGFNGQQVFSVYYHNIRLDVRTGQKVKAGDVIALVGNTGRATNDHLHLEIHVAPTADSGKIVNPAERYPAFTVNPQLWIAPLPGTGVVAGRVLDAAGKPLGAARVYGLVLSYPSETPFVFAETYQEHAHGDAAYGDNFAVGDVPAGRYLIAAVVEDKPIWRVVDVAAGQVTFVEFKPVATTP